MDIIVPEVFTFEMMDGGSKQIRESKVLPGLDIALVEEALKHSQAEEDSKINRWLL